MVEREHREPDHDSSDKRLDPHAAHDEEKTGGQTASDHRTSAVRSLRRQDERVVEGRERGGTDEDAVPEPSLAQSPHRETGASDVGVRGDGSAVLVVSKGRSRESGCRHVVTMPSALHRPASTQSRPRHGWPRDGGVHGRAAWLFEA